jgi:hypothetical protein
VVYQATGSFSGTYQDAATNSYSGTGSDSFTSSDNGASQGTVSIGTSGGLTTSTSSGSSSYAETSSETTLETTTISDSWSAYQAGSFVNGSWALSSVAYSESYTSNFSFQASDSLTNSGTESSSSIATSTGNGTAAYGGATLTGGETTSSSRASSDSFTSSGSDGLTRSGTSTWSLYQLGTFGSESFGFTSVVYQGGDSFSETVTATESDSFTGGETLSGSDQGRSSGLNSFAASLGSGNTSFTEGDSGHFTTAGSHSFSETVTSATASSFYQAGSWSGDSYSLGSVQFGDTVSESYSFQGTDSETDTSLATGTESRRGGSNDTMLTGGAGSITGVDSASSTGTVSAADTTTSLDSYAGSGAESWSFQQQGIFSNFSYNLGTVTYQAAASDTETSFDSSTDCFTETDTATATATSSGASNGTLGLGGGTAQQSLSDSAGDTFSVQGSSSTSETVTSSHCWALYETGNFAGNSYNLSSVAYTDSGSASWSATSLDSVTETALQTRSALATITQTGGFGVSSVALSSQETSAGSETVSGLDTSTATDSVSATGASSWSLSEQGTYSADSYSLGSVMYQQADSAASTEQTTDSDEFQSTNTISANDTSQFGSGDSTASGLNLGGTDTTHNGGTAELDTTTSVDSVTWAMTAASADSSTDYSTSSETVYKAGSFAGGSFGYGSVALLASGSDSFTATDCSSESDTVTQVGTWTVQDNAVASPGAGASFSNTFSSQSSFSSTEYGTHTESETATSSATESGSGSFALTEYGSYTNGSYSLGCYLYQANDSSSASSQQTTTTAETFAGTESHSGGAQQTGTSVFVIQGSGSGSSGGGLGGPPLSLLTVTDYGSSTDSGSSAETLTAVATHTAASAESFSESIFQAGSFTDGSFSYTSMTYAVNSTDSSTVQDGGSNTDVQSVTESLTQSSGQQGGSASDQYSDFESQSYGGVHCHNSAETTTSQDSHSYSLFEAGTFSGQSWNLSSYNSLEQDLLTVSITDVDSKSASNAGSNAVQLAIDGYTVVDGSGTYSSSDSSSGSGQQTTASGWSLSQQGTFSQGSLSLSSYVMTEQSTSTYNDSYSSSGTGTFSGTNQGQLYSGTQSSSASDQAAGNRGDSLSEQGSYANGRFSFGTTSYGGSGQDSFSDQAAASASWSGGYSGTQSSTSADTGTDSYSSGAVGSYSSGVWNLSSYVLNGSSTGCYSNSEADQESLGGSTSSFARSVWGQESDTLYQSGTQGSVGYSNASYSYHDTATGSVTNQASGPGYSSSDTWTNTVTTQQIGSGGSGPQQGTSSASFSYQGGPSGIHNNQTGSATGGLPQGAVSFAAPNNNAGTTVGGAAAVNGGGQWLQSTGDASRQAVGQGSQHAAGQGANGNAAASGSGQGQVGTRGANPGPETRDEAETAPTRPAQGIPPAEPPAEGTNTNLPAPHSVAAPTLTGPPAGTNLARWTPPELEVRQPLQSVRRPSRDLLEDFFVFHARALDRASAGVSTRVLTNRTFGQALNVATDFFSGWSDALTLNATRSYRTSLMDQPVYRDANVYQAGTTVGGLHGTALSVVGGPVTAGWGMASAGTALVNIANTSDDPNLSEYLRIQNPYVRQGVRIAGSAFQVYGGGQMAAPLMMRIAQAAPWAVQGAGDALLVVGVANVANNAVEDRNNPDRASYILNRVEDAVPFAVGWFVTQRLAPSRARVSQQCFRAGTLVATAQGQRPIEEIARGERVWAFDLEQGMWALRPVAHAQQHEFEGDLVTIAVGDDAIDATSSHPFWVIEGEGLQQRPEPQDAGRTDLQVQTPGRWVAAGDLSVGDVLLVRSGKVAVVGWLAIRQVRLRVYNIQVEGLHTYAVGRSQVLVHNRAVENPFGPGVVTRNHPVTGREINTWRDRGQATRVPAHRRIVDDWAERMFETSGYTDIHVNRDFRTIRPGWRRGGRPDLMGERVDGRIDLIEVAHPTQTPDELMGQVRPLWESLPPQRRGDIIIIDSTGRVLQMFP